MLCIWWDQKGVVHHEVLNPGETSTADCYRHQMGIERITAGKEKIKFSFTTTMQDQIVQTPLNTRTLVGIGLINLRTLQTLLLLTIICFDLCKWIWNTLPKHRRRAKFGRWLDIWERRGTLSTRNPQTATKMSTMANDGQYIG